MSTCSTAVVVPVFNRARTVLATLASIAGQTRRADKLIVVDDGSTDGTCRTVRKWLKTADLNAQIIRTKNLGPGAARNIGMRYAGENAFIAFVDSDDVWPADFLQQGIAALQQAPNAIAATTDRLLDWVDGQKRFVPMSEIADNASRWLFLHDGGIVSATIFRASGVRDLGGFPEKWGTGQDSALFLPLSLEGDWLYFPARPVRHRIGYSASIGEQDNISTQFPDRHRIWAEIHEDFVLAGRGRDALEKADYEPMLSTYWYRAGRDLMRQGRDDEAKNCFRKSLRWRFKWKASLKLVRLNVLGRMPQIALKHAPFLNL